MDETRNYFLEEIKQNELMSRKYKKVCTTLIYIEHFLILVQILDVFQFLQHFIHPLPLPTHTIKSGL